MPDLKHTERYKINTQNDQQVNTESVENSRNILNVDTNFTVKKDGSADFESFWTAVNTLANNFEINETSILFLDETGDFIIDDELPMFFGKGTLIIDGQGSSLSFSNNTINSVIIKNYTSINLIFKNIKLKPGNSSNPSLYVEGQNITFDNINFGTYKCTFENCNNLTILNSKNSTLKFYKSTLNITLCKFKIELYGCKSELKNCTIPDPFIVKEGSITLDNPRFNYKYWVSTNKIQNASVDLTGWLTILNVGGGNIITRNLISLEACSINRLPFNIDLQGGVYTFDAAYAINMVNCTTPATFPSVKYNFTTHSFINNGAVFGLFSSSILPNINGAVVYRDSLSTYNSSNFNPGSTSLTSVTIEEAIIELYNLFITSNSNSNSNSNSKKNKK